LSAERCSIMGLYDGKFIQAYNGFKEEFFLAFGHNNYIYKIILIDKLKQIAYVFYSENPVYKIAVNIAFDFVNNNIQSIVKKYNFEQVKNS